LGEIPNRERERERERDTKQRKTHSTRGEVLRNATQHATMLTWSLNPKTQTVTRK